MNWLRNLLLPVEGSAYARDVDNLFLFLVWLSVFFFVLIAGLAGFFVWRYRRRRADDRPPHVADNHVLEIVWSVVPLLILIGIFFWGFDGYMKASVAPGEAMEIQVVAKKWLWQFEYPNGTRTINEIHVPVGRPVKLVMSSEDVIHSFFAPSFRVKNDILPNRYTEVWFEPREPGQHTIFCTEYCGKGHSDMLGRIWVDDDAKYQDWLENGDENTRKMPLSELGALLYESRGCATCHSLDGTPGQGPSFQGIFGKEEKMDDGKTVKVDENYLRQSMLDPQSLILAGYEGIMPTFQGLLREREILALIEFIKTRK